MLEEFNIDTRKLVSGQHPLEFFSGWAQQDGTAQMTRGHVEVIYLEVEGDLLPRFLVEKTERTVVMPPPGWRDT